MDAEREVRTRAGWIGVEISKSRVRTPGKAGYGLYRVRGSVSHRTRAELDGLIDGAVTPDGVAERGPWTEYLFELEAIDLAVEVAIGSGVPTGPRDLVLYHPNPKRARGDKPAMIVPTRWTHRYQGRRDLGVAPSLGETPHRADGCHMEGWPHLGPCCGPEVPEAERGHAPRCPCPRCVKFRQREYNAAFQAEHAVRRERGLKARHAGRGRDA